MTELQKTDFEKALKFLERMEKATSKETCGDWSARILIENLSTMTKVIREQMAALAKIKADSKSFVATCIDPKISHPLHTAKSALDSTTKQLAALEQ